MRSTPRSLLLVVIMALAAGCGFQLRGSYSLPYESLYVAVADTSVTGAAIKRAIRASGSTRLAESTEDAQATFRNTLEAREPVILSLSGAGRVREKRLRLRYGYRVVDGKGRDLIAPGVIELNRDITYADSAVLAKTQEEDLLWRDMESDLVQQLMRRLGASKPVTPSEE